MAVKTQTPLTAEQLGTLENRLDLLTEDRRHLRPAALCSVTQLTPTIIAGVLGIQRPRLYRRELALEGKMARPIQQIVEVTDRACHLFGDDIKETKRWLMAPNTMFFSASPFEVIMRGDGQEVLNMLHERLGQRAGEAF